MYRQLHDTDDDEEEVAELAARERWRKVKAKGVGDDTYEGEEMAGLGSGFLPPIGINGSGFSPLEDIISAIKIGKDSQLGDMHYKYIHYYPSIALKTSLSMPENLIMPRREGFSFEWSGSLKKEDTLYAMQTLSDASDSRTENLDSRINSVELACLTYVTAARIRSHLAGPVLKYKPNKAEKAELDRMEALFTLAARPLCVFFKPGTRELQSNHADDAMQGLLSKYQEDLHIAGFDLLSFVNKRGE
jgi:hypothetical protein